MRYTIPESVENLHRGCNDILTTWNFYNNKGWPKFNNATERHTSSLAHLTPEQYDLVTSTMKDLQTARHCSLFKKYREGRRQVAEARAAANVEARASSDIELINNKDDSSFESQGLDWDHPFYWISQLFDPRWEALPTYKAENEPTDN